MEGNEEKDASKNGCKNGITKLIFKKLTQFANNITTLDLSDRNIVKLDENMNLPPNLTNLNISRNKLIEVPPAVLHLDRLKILDLSYNSIAFFDDIPSFIHSIEELNLSQNRLKGPPYWVWSEAPKNLLKLNLSYNKDLCQTLVDGYLEELLNFNTSVQELDIFSCKLSVHLTLMGTFKNAKIINLGSSNEDYCSTNHLVTLPFKGIDQCCDIIRLNVTNTHIYTIDSNVDIYKSIVEINLSDNYIHSLPNEFCNLFSLKICILSYNKLLYLPEDIYKLSQLNMLLLDNNELCMLPTCLNDMSHLTLLDIYNNNLYDGINVDSIENLSGIDMAQNYFEEPISTEYEIKKEKLRLSTENLERRNGSKPEEAYVDSERSRNSSDDELHAMNSDGNDQKEPTHRNTSIRSNSSSSEDWDSDEHWIPRYFSPVTHRLPWLSFIKQKIAEGNFCPIDAHTCSIAEQVKYEKLCNPQEVYESDGQFDDYSGDDS